MRWIETVLYVLSFFGLVVGLRLLLIQDREVAITLQHALGASSGVPPPDDPSFHFTMDQQLWGSGAARWVAKALAISQKGQTAGSWTALAGGLLGLAATLLAVWT